MEIYSTRWEVGVNNGLKCILRFIENIHIMTLYKVEQSIYSKNRDFKDVKMVLGK